MDDDMFAQLDDGNDLTEYRAAMAKAQEQAAELMAGEHHRLSLRFFHSDGPLPIVTCLDEREGTDRPCYAQGTNAEQCIVAFAATELGWDSFVPFHNGKEIGYKDSVLVPIEGPVRYYSTGSGEDYEDWFGIDREPEPVVWPQGDDTPEKL